MIYLLCLEAILGTQNPSTIQVKQVAPHHQMHPVSEEINPPVLPFGVSTQFQSEVLGVESALSKGEFENAAALYKKLPKNRLNILWDDRKLPSSMRDKFFVVVSNTIRAFVGSEDIQIKVASTTDPASIKLDGPPDITFEFTSQLAKPENATEPLSLALLFQDTTGGEKTLDAVMGLKVGSEGKPLTNIEISNNVAYSLGRYYGLTKSPIIGSFLYHIEGVSDFPNMGLPIDTTALTQNLLAINTLHTAIQKKKPLVPSKSSLFLNPVAVTLDKSLLEGEIIDIPFQITNTGNGPLIMRLVPDCSCFSAQPSTPIPAGSSLVYHVSMNTDHYFGSVHKELYLLTNDPSVPAMSIPVDLRINPDYRFLMPSGTTVYAQNNQATATVFLTTDASHLKVLASDVSGMKSKLTTSPWSGTIQDPVLDKAPTQHSGFLFQFHLGPNLPKGQQQYTLDVATDDASIGTIHTTFFVNNGIVPTPLTMTIGEQPGGAASFPFTLTNPNRAFKIISTKVTIPHFKVIEIDTNSKIKEGGNLLKFKLLYDGLAISGNVSGAIILTTNDPEQKKIYIPITGSID